LWPLDGLRIDAIFQILYAHVCAALAATAAIGATRGARRAPGWITKAVLVVLPFGLGLSCDRLALLAYPPTRLGPSAAQPAQRARGLIRSAIACECYLNVR
jgi:hypothetical protein